MMKEVFQTDFDAGKKRRQEGIAFFSYRLSGNNTKQHTAENYNFLP